MPAVSRLHHLIETMTPALNGPMYGRDPEGRIIKHDIDPRKVAVILQAMSEVPHYLFDRDTVKTLTTGSAAQQLQALHAVGALHLPHPLIVVEIAEIENGFNGIFLIQELREEDQKDGMRFVVYCFSSGKLGNGVPFGYMFKDMPPDFSQWLVAPIKGFEPHIDSGVWPDKLSKLMEMALIFTRVKGLAHTVEPAPERLNKQREAKGKPPIREFTRLYIGRVEDSSGKSHAYTGRTMPVHMRSGHTRNQRYGKGRAMVKTVYIPPVLVNFKQGDEVPVPRRVVKMAS